MRKTKGEKSSDHSFKVALIFEIEQHYHREVLAGVLSYRREHGGLEVLNRSGMPFLKPTRLALAEGDGILGFLSKRDLASSPQLKDKPAVTVSNKPEAGRLSVVCSDDRAVGRMAAAYLNSLGLRNLAVLGWWNGYAGARADGFVEAVQPLGRTCRIFHPKVSVRTVERERELDEEIGAWLRWLPTPCGIYCVDDRLAVEVHKWARSLGRRVPDDWAILGTDNDHLLLELLDCPVSSVELNGRQIGFEAAKLLARQLRGEAAGPVRLEIPPQRIVPRASTDLRYDEDPIVRVILKRMIADPGCAWTVASLVEGLGLSRRAAELRFRKQTGGGIYDRLIELRIAHAKEALIEGTESVGRISEKLGFYDQRQLSHLFKLRTGMTPREFRNRHRTSGAHDS
jgi:LacI family transcriptional regulator